MYFHFFMRMYIEIYILHMQIYAHWNVSIVYLPTWDDDPNRLAVPGWSDATVVLPQWESPLWRAVSERLGRLGRRDVGDMTRYKQTRS